MVQESGLRAGRIYGLWRQPIAAVREYMDQKKWKEAEAQVPQVAQVLANVAAGIDKAAADLESGLPKAH
jgi:DNA-binding ferritin-like protein